MEFYNPITELEWVTGEWKGHMIIDEEEISAALTVRPIGSEILEFDLTTVNNNSKNQFEKSILIFDRTHEIVKSFSINNEGYMEISELSISNRNKHTEINSSFCSGINLPPNMKIIKKWIFRKNPKTLNYEVRMGKESKIVLSTELEFSKPI